jgi:hypothetical protein
MADLRRLGKRGSYRLGRLGAPSPAPAAPPAPHYPSWGRGHRGPASLWLLACVAGVLLIAAGALQGLWFLPFLAGLATGVAARHGHLRLRVTLPAAAAMAAAGWGAALWWLVLRGLPDGAVAREVAALAGLPPYAAVTVVAVLLVAVIQALAGLWLGRALAPGQAVR